MNDTISREAVADAINGIECTRHTTWYEFYQKVMTAVEKLPPTQPKIVRCKDCRYGILDSGFPHQYFCQFKGNEWNNEDYFCGHAERREVTGAEIREVINSQPTIHPEIIRCRECKFASGDSRICMKFDHSPIGELDFCSFAEMREVTT